MIVKIFGELFSTIHNDQNFDHILNSIPNSILLDGETLTYGPFVDGQGYTLSEAGRYEYEYPIDGWYWFDTADEAYSFFGIEKPVVEEFMRDIPVFR
jgi:hypothetical protein